MIAAVSITDIFRWNNEFLFGEISTTPISAVRILTGLLLLIEAFYWSLNYKKLIGVDGWYSLPLFRQHERKERFSLLAFLPASNASVQLLIALLAVAAAMLCAGFYPSLSAGICLLVLISFHNRNHFMLNSGDTVRRFLCLFLVFAPATSQVTPADFLAGTINGNTGWAWTTWMLQFFMVNIYIKNVYFKLMGKSWRAGMATKEVFGVRIYNYFALPSWLNKTWYFKLTTYGTLVVETALFTLIWFDEFRLYVLLAGVILHIGMAVHLKVRFFQLSMLCGLAIFITAEEYSAAMTWLRMQFGM